MKLVVPLSGTKGSERGLELAIPLAKRVGAAVELVNVVDTRSTVHEAYDVRYSAAEAYLGAAAALVASEIEVATHLLVGDPVEEISRLTRDIADCILVLAPRWRGDLNPFMPDSISQQVVRNATSPVILVPERYEFNAPVSQNMIVPVTKTSPAVEEIVDVCQTLRSSSITVRLVAVNSAMDAANGYRIPASGDHDGSLDEQDEYKARLRLLSLGSALRRYGIKSNWELRVGAPVYEIVRAADTTGAEFIAFIRPGADNPADEKVVTSALTVSHHAGVPVLIVPSAARSSENQNDNAALSHA